MDETFQSSLQAGLDAMRVGSPEVARGHFERAYQLAGGVIEQAEALARLGRALASLGDFAEAERLLHEATALAAHAPVTLAVVHMQLGVVCWLQGNLGAARGLLEDAAREFQQEGQVRHRSMALGNLAVVLLAQGDYARAIRAFRETAGLHESLNDLNSLVYDYNNVGECYADLGMYDLAEAAYRQAIELAETQNAPALAIAPRCNLGGVLAARGAFDEALMLVEEASTAAETYQRHYLRPSILEMRSEVHLLRNEPAEAAALGEQMLALALASDSPHLRAEARLVLGRAWLAQGDSARALGVLSEGMLDAERAFSKMLSLRCHAALAGLVDHPAIAAVHQRMARELVGQILDSLEGDRALQEAFRGSGLVRELG